MATLSLYSINLLSAIFTNYPTRWFGQKATLIGGHVVMAVLLLLTSLFNELAMGYMVLICLILFIATFNMAIGSIAFIHA